MAGGAGSCAPARDDASFLYGLPGNAERSAKIGAQFEAGDPHPVFVQDIEVPSGEMAGSESYHEQACGCRAGFNAVEAGQRAGRGRCSEGSAGKKRKDGPSMGASTREVLGERAGRRCSFRMERICCCHRRSRSGCGMRSSVGHG